MINRNLSSVYLKPRTIKCEGEIHVIQLLLKYSTVELFCNNKHKGKRFYVLLRKSQNYNWVFNYRYATCIAANGS